jgi:hypothetical protein
LKFSIENNQIDVHAKEIFFSALLKYKSEVYSNHCFLKRQVIEERICRSDQDSNPVLSVSKANYDIQSIEQWEKSRPVGCMVGFDLVKALIHPSYHKECMSVAFNNSNIDINFL